MGISLGHLIVILLIVLVLFGAGKLPQVMGDLGKGLKAFKKNFNEDSDGPSHDLSKQIDSDEDKKK